MEKLVQRFPQCIEFDRFDTVAFQRTFVYFWKTNSLTHLPTVDKWSANLNLLRLNLREPWTLLGVSVHPRCTNTYFPLHYCTLPFLHFGATIDVHAFQLSLQDSVVAVGA